jgi:pimeloyl-ACP methyl ester carboxylesterase
MSVGALMLGLAIDRAWGMRVVAGEHWVRMHISGKRYKADPAVVLLSGLGGPLEEWAKIQPEIGQFALAVSYDRGNTKGSAPCAGPHDAVHIADELHEALASAGVQPPYLLVAHSLGGPFARVFAHRYPAEVAGMVLIEPTQESLFHPEAFHVGDDDRRLDSELVYVVQTLTQAKAAAPLPQVPVTVITGTRELNDRESRAYRPDLLVARAQWIASIPNGRHVLAQNSYHLPQMTEPSLVVQVIRETFEDARHRVK